MTESMIWIMPLPALIFAVLILASLTFFTHCPGVRKLEGSIGAPLRLARGVEGERPTNLTVSPATTW